MSRHALGWILVCVLVVGCDGGSSNVPWPRAQRATIVSISDATVGSIQLESPYSRIRWSCGFMREDPLLCRGRADGTRTVLRFYDRSPVTFVSRTFMIYRREDEIIGFVLTAEASSTREMIDQFAYLIENRYDTSVTPRLRACGTNGAISAIANAEHNINEPASSICADRPPLQVTWRFARTSKEHHRLMELTIHPIDLQHANWLF